MFWTEGDCGWLLLQVKRTSLLRDEEHGRALRYLKPLLLMLSTSLCQLRSGRFASFKSILNLGIIDTERHGVLYHREPPEHVHHVATNLKEALEIASRPPLCDVVDKIWVLGGVSIYKVRFFRFNWLKSILGAVQ